MPVPAIETRRVHWFTYVNNTEPRAAAAVVLLEFSTATWPAYQWDRGMFTPPKTELSPFCTSTRTRRCHTGDYGYELLLLMQRRPAPVDASTLQGYQDESEALCWAWFRLQVFSLSLYHIKSLDTCMEY